MNILAALTGPEWDRILDRLISLVTALCALVAAVGVLLSKLRGDKQAAAAQRIEAKTNTTIAQNQTLDAKANIQIMQNEQIVNSVNGPLTHALKSNAVLAEKVADLTGTTADDVTARVARKISDDRVEDVRASSAQIILPHKDILP